MGRVSSGVLIMSWLKNAAGLWLPGKKKRCKLCSDPRYRRELKRRGGFAGYPCCCKGGGCDIFSDDFDRADDTDLGDDWDEVSGSWEIASNQLVCTSPGVVLCNTSHPDGDSTMVVECDIRHDTNGRSCDILVAVVDANNYFYARYTFNGSFGSIAIRRNNAGSHSQVAIISSQTININTTYSAKVCVNEMGHISAYLNGVWKVAGFLQPVLGTKAGLGCNSSGTAAFDSFVFKKSKAAASATCEECELGGCGGCQGDTTPTQWQVTVPVGTFTGGGGNPSGLICDSGSCDELNDSVYVCDRLLGDSFVCYWISPNIELSCGETVAIQVRSGSGVGGLGVSLVLPQFVRHVEFLKALTFPIDCSSISSLEIPFGSQRDSPFHRVCSSAIGKSVYVDAL